MRLLLDTAVWCNLTTHPELVPGWVHALIEGEDQVGLASVSLLEAAILHRIGRLAFDGTVAEFFAEALARNVQVLEMSAAIAAETCALPAGFNGDPFDRAVAATARVLHLVPVTTDVMIRDHGGLPEVKFYPFRRSRSSKHPPA